ncbi:96eb81aa-d077-4198-b423-25604dd818c4 [Sclerotinia trifoliorum]|uniref:96eb81aa-d077-4198-b423-25604dd818c4 n=1 Tax=Sclerotinia trifoliorum TaxID=28548 RepID=A0A8H2W0G9_9HELO|nr:96eb81aa-d077-4198-b423-25604dd818c4 [Sclerotinia trifoliorum]
MSTAAEKANLARIRDNQRRSRARRKEYLQELEARLRQCELQGIEASSEIQMAARRVADENKKLRSLLAQQGVGSDIVESYLQMSSEDLMMSGQYASESTSVQQLEHLLQSRKACCPDGNGHPSATTMGQTVRSRESSCSANTVHSLWDPVHTSGSLSVGQTQPSIVKGVSSAQQFMGPRRSSAASRHGSISQNPSTARTVHNQQQQQTFNMTPLALPNTQHGIPSSLSVQTPSVYDFDPQYLSNQSYHNLSPQTPHMHPHLQSHTNPHSNSNPNTRSSISSHQTSPPISTTYTTTMTTDNNGPNMNSCIFATDMITTMAGGDPAVVRAELGCMPDMDCNVDNHLVFHVMDRYTGNGVGL